ncbi:MAG: tellurite resistance/C4-dicarboxylate transporter family protein [Nakamurella sp.]
METFRRHVPDMAPDAFALVMATGIVSVAADDHGYRPVGAVLAALATAAFAVLAIAWGWHFLTHRGDVIADFRDPDVALRMFTFVAGACVLGVVWLREPSIVWIFAACAGAGWLLLIPLSARDVRSRPRTELRNHVHGAWLLVSVATSGLATTAGDLAAGHSIGWLLYLGIVAWVVAWVLYVAVTYLILWRVWAQPFRAESIAPDAWILMGALAISALAGAHLLEASRALAPSAVVSDAVQGAMMVVWIVATAWIPVLTAAQVWRLIRVPRSLQFANVWWSAVFPLGMYASATAAIAHDLRLAVLPSISLVFTWIGLAAWLAAAVGLVRKSVHRPMRRRAARDR